MKPLSVRLFSGIIRLIAICSCLLLLTACHKTLQGPEPPAVEGNLSLQLDCRGIDLRSGDEDPMSAMETLDLYFFSGSAEPEERTIVAHRSFGRSALASHTPLSVTLPVSSFYLVAVLNATPAVHQQLGLGTSWSKLSSVTQRLVDLYTIDNNKLVSVVWSNDQGPIRIDESAFAKGATAVRIPLTRSVARIRLFGKPKTPGYISLDATHGGVFVPASRASKSYLMRELAPLVGVSGEPMEQPGDSSLYATRYAYSPGYHEIAKSSPSDYRTLVENYRIYNQSKTIFNIEALRLVPETLDACNLKQRLYYISETTIDPKHTSYCFLPAVLVGYKVYPTSLASLTDFTADEGWVSFNGDYYRGRDFKTYLTAIYKRNKSGVHPKPPITVPANYPQRLQAICEEYAASYGDKMFIQTPAYQGELYGIDFKGLRYYLRSYNYYYIPIHHKVDQQGYGQYGVVRNNDYRIEIKSISNYGAPVLMNPIDHFETFASEQALLSTISLTPLVEHDDTADL